MKSPIPLTRTCCLLLLLTVVLGGLPPVAHAQSAREKNPPLPSDIERALIYNSSQDFFRQGMSRFEQEIQQLRDRKFAVAQELLRVREAVRDRFLDEELPPLNQ